MRKLRATYETATQLEFFPMIQKHNIKQNSVGKKLEKRWRELEKYSFFFGRFVRANHVQGDKYSPSLPSPLFWAQYLFAYQLIQSYVN